MPWSSLFAMGCWQLWKWLNNTIFEDQFSYPHNIIGIGKTKELAKSLGFSGEDKLKFQKLVAWIPILKEL